jgi:translation initiation factor 2D
VEGSYVPNAGFFEDVVFGDPALSQPPVDDLSEIGEETTEEKKKLLPDNDQMVETAEELSTDVSSVLKIAESTSEDNKNEEEEEEHIMTVEEIDALLDKCLLQALHTSVKDKDLPIPGSTLWY